MKITKANIPKFFNDNGIASIEMGKLGQVVLIAGKNGSGKSRLLKKIEGALNSKPIKSSLEASRQRIPDYEIQKQNYERSLSELEDQFKITTEPNAFHLKSSIDSLKSSIQNFTAQIANDKSIIDWNLLETDELAEKNTCVYFVPKQLELQDSNNFGKNQLIDFANSVDTIGIQNLSNGTFAKIQYVQDRWFNATHQDSKIANEAKEQAIEDYEKLKELLKIFLNTSIKRDLNGNATLFGFLLGQTNLSEGQKILLQFCVAIYSQNTNLKDLILIMDEPENHLHPSVIVETIDRIFSYVTNGQVWIATHSIPLLAHFNSSSIWYMEKGSISYAGSIPEKVLESLLGDEEEIAKLQDFIGLPAQLALNRFAYECLFEPQIVVTGKDDPQVLQIKNELRKFEKDEKIKILDYGIGKGRLLANIVENLGENLQAFTDKFDYIGFDKFDTDKKDCEDLLTTVYASIAGKYFNDYGSLLSRHDKASFDIIIMSNVLHEIEPKDWLTLFSKDGWITSLLTNNGRLLLIEDMQIPVGEKAYQNGFIVLDTPQLKELFNMKQTEFVYDDARNNGRLKCHVITKECLARIDENSKKLALQSLEKIAKDKIIQIRNSSRDYKNGKIHGYWVQQFANTSLALSEITND